VSALGRGVIQLIQDLNGEEKALCAPKKIIS
jgi:hypothetical protein